MTQKEHEIIAGVVSFFDYHNKNMTKEQDWQIYKLKQMLKQGGK